MIDETEKASDGSPLWAVAWERIGKDDRGNPIIVQAELSYCHAIDAHRARVSFIVAHPSSEYRIVDVALAIGYHVEDKKGLILRV